MRKLVNLVCLLLVSSCFLFAQSFSDDSYFEYPEYDKSSSANRNIAIRCLKLSENYLMSNDLENALRQAELGLAYDDSISDLFYLKAAACAKLRKPKIEILEYIETAFEKDEWVSYTKNGARILYADLLSDTRRYEESLKVLDEDPLLFSADAEFIRIKNLYRMGTEKSIRDARDKVSIASRIYSKDLRFPNIFFMFELMFLDDAERNGETYTIPKTVQKIADVYIKKIPKYKDDSHSIEIMASFFETDEDEKVRNIRAIVSKNEYENTLLAYAGLITGVYSEQQAFDMFFEFANNFIYLGLLENFALHITEEGVKQSFKEKLLNYNGYLVIDNNNDLQPEIKVLYKAGRPVNIEYDFNNDDCVDMSCECDFGVPNSIFFETNKSFVTYEDYPNVQNVSYTGKDFVFNFYNGDFVVKPIDFKANKILKDLGFDFFVPEVSSELKIFTIDEIKKIANSVELPITERENARVVYTTSEGESLFADFYERDFRYAYCDLSKGFPLHRYVDQDNNGVFETDEIYNIAKNAEDYVTEDEKALVNSIFNPITFDEDIYLSCVKIDRNSNTKYEFTEEFLGKEGKISTWDNNDDGIADSRYIKYPKEKGEALKEESIFFYPNGEPYISIQFLGGIPIKMDYKGSEVLVFAGESNNFYWIDTEGSKDDEKLILENIAPNLKNGIIQLIHLNEHRMSLINVNDKIFCKIIPFSEYEKE